MDAHSISQLLGLTGIGWSEGGLLLSVHPDGSRLAAARGPALCICPLLATPAPSPATQLGPSSQSAPAGAPPGPEDGRAVAPPEDLLEERRQTHGSAGPRAPPRFSCRKAAGPVVTCKDDITALAWLAFARPPGSGSPGRSGGASGGGARAHGSCGGGDWSGGGEWRDAGESGGSSRRRHTGSSGSGAGIFASIQAMVEDHELQQQEGRSASASSFAAIPAGHLPGVSHPGYIVVALLSGTRGGALQLHDADSGAVLLRQQVHPGPVVSITVRTWRMGLRPDEAVEDVTVGWGDAVVRLAAWELRAAATSCYAAAAAAAAARALGGGAGAGASRFGLWGSSAPAGPEVKPLEFQKWELPHAARGRSSVVCCGQRPRSLYALLQGAGPSSGSSWSGAAGTGKTVFLAGGGRPACLAALQIDEQAGGGGALSYITSVATSVSSGVMGLARTATSVATAPLALGNGLRSFLLNPLQLGGFHHNSSRARDNGGDAGAAGIAAAGSQAPLASFADASNGQRPPSAGVWRQFRDDGRAVLTLAPAPHGSLVAAVDGLGRVLLVEVGTMLVTRMWKGYRDAQVGWLEVRAGMVRRLMVVQQEQKQHQHQQEGELPQDGLQGNQGSKGDPYRRPDHHHRHQHDHRNYDRHHQRSALASQPAVELQDERKTRLGGPWTGDAPERAAEEGGSGGCEQIADGQEQSQPQPTKHGSGSQLPPSRPPLPASGRSKPAPLHPRNVLHPYLPSKASTAAVAASGQGLYEQHGSRLADADAVTDENGDDAYVLLLVVYGPRRQTLELWWPLQGARLAAVTVPERGRLLPRGGGGDGAELGTWRVADAASVATPPLAPAGCFMCFWGHASVLEYGGVLAELDQEVQLQGRGRQEGFEMVDVAAVFGLL